MNKTENILKARNYNKSDGSIMNTIESQLLQKVLLKKQTNIKVYFIIVKFLVSFAQIMLNFFLMRVVHFSLATEIEF